MVTPKQKAILEFIRSCSDANGFAPSYREIAAHFGYTSPATVHQFVTTLKEKGLLTMDSSKARSLQSTAQSEQPLRVMELPLLGIIAAGEPIEAIENPEMMAVPESLISNPHSYILRVRGTSMIEAGIMDGDYVIVERNFYPQNGDIVVALLDNQYATLKKYYREKDTIRLQPANASMAPLFVKNPAIQGVVRALMRRF